MARTKKASNDQQTRKSVRQQSSSSAELANNKAASTPIRSSTTSCGPLSRSLRSKNENVNFNGTFTTDTVTNEDNVSGITDDLEISGVSALSALMTDDSEASSVIDLTESINKPEENSELTNGDDHEGSGRRKSIKKPLKRLTRTTTTPHYNIANGRTSKGTPYIRKVSTINHRNHLANELKFSTGKKERIANEIKKSGTVKRVTFNKSPSMKASSSTSTVKLNETQLDSTKKKQSAVKMPNFSDIHKKMFEKMESIDVTVRKREERKQAASTTKKETQVSAQGASTTSKKVVRKLDNPQTVAPNIPLADIAEIVTKLPKPVRSKSLRSAPIAEVLQERSNRNAVFKFTGSSDPKILSQPVPDKKTVENRTARRQQAYKSRPGPKSDAQSSNRLRGVRLNRRFELQMKYRENQNDL